MSHKQIFDRSSRGAVFTFCEKCVIKTDKKRSFEKTVFVHLKRLMKGGGLNGFSEGCRG